MFFNWSGTYSNQRVAALLEKFTKWCLEKFSRILPTYLPFRDKGTKKNSGARLCSLGVLLKQHIFLLKYINRYFAYLYIKVTACLCVP